MARSIFNGTLRIADESVPVKLYAAVEPRPVGFRLLHASDHVGVRQRMVHPESGEEVPREDARKGLVLPGGMVVLHDEELAELAPERTRDIEVLRFVEPARLDHRWYVRPYYLGPNGDAPEYFALARALAAEDKEGVVRWTMRNKLYHGALRSTGDYLVLISLRSAAELVAVSALPERSWPTPSKPELKMAKQLVEMLEADLDLDEFKDRYAEQVAELVEAKAAGQAPKLPKPKKKRAAEPSLTDALAASIAQIEEQRVA